MNSPIIYIQNIEGVSVAKSDTRGDGEGSEKSEEP
jgi:hypothetical protein